MNSDYPPGLEGLMNSRPDLGIMEKHIQLHGMSYADLVEGSLDYKSLARGSRSALAVMDGEVLQFPRIHYSEEDKITCNGIALTGVYIAIEVNSPKTNATLVVVSGDNGCIHFNITAAKHVIAAIEKNIGEPYQMGLGF
ncbi:hypothetical protein HYV12_00345 [Candidatus Dojkabacteria bacterium]|nr:hypothetical protein [Candidatus Dojkabacteria bacterium]